jgi:hypothetical protein
MLVYYNNSVIQMFLHPHSQQINDVEEKYVHGNDMLNKSAIIKIVHLMPDELRDRPYEIQTHFINSR